MHDFSALELAPADREHPDLEAIADLLWKLAGSFASQLEESQLNDICKRGLLLSLDDEFATVCTQDEPAESFFVLLSGSVMLEERAVHHNDLAKGVRKWVVAPGHGFHHLPFLNRDKKYGYSARVAGQNGAKLLVIPKADYTSILLREVEREVRDTVSMLLRNKLFSSWSDAALMRLYFWFVRRAVKAGEYVVRQGDDAESAFFIQSGTCLVLVNAEDTGTAAERTTMRKASHSLQSALKGAMAPNAAAAANAAKGLNVPSAAAQQSLSDSFKRRAVGSLSDAGSQVLGLALTAAAPSGSSRRQSGNSAPGSAGSGRRQSTASGIADVARRQSTASGIADVAHRQSTAGGMMARRMSRVGDTGVAIKDMLEAAPSSSHTRRRSASYEALEEEPASGQAPTAPSSAPLPVRGRRSTGGGGAAPTAAAPPDVPMRHVATLREGALFGEIALLRDGDKRNATVRADTPCVVLELDKTSFRELDKETLTLIAEDARYSAACTRPPTQRTPNDLRTLQQRTQSLARRFSHDAHLELCRVMRYRKCASGEMIVRKGTPATCLHVLISGSAHTYASDPKIFTMMGAINAVMGATPSVEAFSLLTPTETLHSGEVMPHGSHRARSSPTAL
jgi:CRP-like cAMP-binding protein